MNKKTIIFIAVTIVVLLLAGMGYLIYSLNKSNEENKQMLELAEMDKREMENEYENFARQYNEMKTQVNNDSLMAQLEQEREQGEGVRPARARDDDMRAARQKSLPPHMLIETMREMRQLRHSVPPRRNR